MTTDGAVRGSSCVGRWGRSAAAGLALAVTVAGAAQADTWSKEDPKGDNKGGGGDIAAVRVSHSPKTVKLTWEWATEDDYPSGTFWQVDTVADDAGPEFMVGWTYDAHKSVILYRVEDWSHGWYGGAGGEDVKCKGEKVASLSDFTGQVFSIPRKCLATDGKAPKKVRVNLETTDLSAKQPQDTAPASEKFGAWVKAGKSKGSGGGSGGDGIE